MKVLVSGSTGMVGKGLLFECLYGRRIAQVLLINRSPIDIDHPKIRDIIHRDFTI